MPYPRTSAGYPASMRALIEDVCADNLARKVSLASAKEAAGLRSRFYSYIAAIKRDLTKRPAWLDPAAAEDLTDFLKRAMTVEFRIEDKDLIVRPRDESPLTDSLRAATILPSRDAPAEAADPAADTLARLLGKTK